ncbi:MAG: carboxypeptidase-like regulatory domain-containing protein [Planctomycetaceae bacterium]|nr:carboxypeptidase-like regulatory domain-containing protein [Planctomycetaceae bacterium]
MNTKNFFFVSVLLFVLVLSSQLTADDFTINGTVSDESGKLVTDAQVYIGKDALNNEKISITDDNGHFTLPLPAEEINSWQRLYAIAPDKKQIGSTVIRFNEGNITIPDILITLKPVRIITGNVTDSNDKPIEGVLVAGVDQIVYPNFKKTDKNGDFSFAYPKDDLKPLQKIVAFLENVGMDYICTEESERDRGKIQPEKIKNGHFQLKLNPFESHKFRVTDEKGTPLSGINIHPWLIKKENEKDSFNTAAFFNLDCYLESLTGTDGTAVVQSIGKTTFIASGTKEGTVMPDGSRCFFASVDKRYDDFDSTFVLKRRGNVKGSVRLADGTPVMWSRITIRDYNGGHGINFTDQKGEFTLGCKANELFDIGVESKLGAAPGILGFNTGNGTEEKRLDFVLQKGIRLHGTVYKPDKTPAEKYQIFIYEKSPEDLLTTTQNTLDLLAVIKNTLGNKDNTTRPQMVIRQHNDYFEPNSQGKYEYLLPATARKYNINVSLYYDPDLIFVLEDYEVKGNENEILLDIHLKPKEKE